MQQTKRHLIPALLGLLVIAALALAGYLQSQAPDLPAIPELAVADFSQPVQEQLLAARAQLLEAPEDAQRNLELGRILHAYKLLPSAIVCYRRARLLQPEEFATVYLLGIAQIQVGDDAGATDNLRAALALNPDDAPARLRLGEVLFKGGKLEEARALFEALLKQQPDSAWAHHRLAQVLAALGDPAGAIDQNRRAIELYENFGAAQYALALAYRDRGELQLAEAHMARYREHPEQSPAHVDALLEALDALDISATAQVRRAKRLERAGRMQDALQALQQAVAVEPDSVEAHSQLVRMYHRFNDTGRAEQHYRAVTAIEPNAVMVNLEYGTLLAEQGRIADAATAFEKVLTADPDHSAAHTLLAQAREELQQPAEAERHYRLALDSDPNNHRAALLLGRLLMLGERHTEAEPFLELAGAAEPRERAFYLQRIAQVRHEAGQREQALAVLEQARAQAAELGQQYLLNEIMQTQTQWQESP
ncbi:MAG TPA: tetratricopeptide repeat protein [Gammaproteobacteria bacterium]|nr:tetratricopeptide repeat protein [Gammaproteobacteria bacterium]